MTGIFLALAKFALIGCGITLCAALSLIFWPQSAGRAPEPGAGGLDFSAVSGPGFAPPEEAIAARDGTPIRFRAFGAGAGARPLVIALHGSGWHGFQFQALCAEIADTGLADCIARDLRGHGADPATRGDVASIGQFEDDIADLIAARSGGAPVILLGHSSGGGLVARFAGGPHGDQIAGAILLAPFLGHNAPSQRPNSGGWARVRTARIIGLSILNGFRITALNHLPVIDFNFPEEIRTGPLAHTITATYSHRLNASYAPRRDYRKDIAALPEYLLIAGADDEAFHAERYAAVMADAGARGETQVIANVGHLGIVDHAESLAAIVRYLERFHER